MKRLLSFLTTILLLCIPYVSRAQEQQFTLLPDTSLYRQYYADALTHQLSLFKNTDTREWNGNIGGVLPLALYSNKYQRFELSLGATVFNTLVKSPGHIQVFTVDYLVEFFGDVSLKDNLIGRCIWGHLSAHYSDDGIVELHSTPMNYVRDYFGVHAEYLYPETEGKLYIGAFYLYHNEPDPNKRWTWQIGGDLGTRLTDDIFFYGAFDCKIKSEVNYGTTQSYQLGIRYPAPAQQRAIRFTLTHRRGFEERGQLYFINENRNFLGLSLEF